MMLEIAEQRMGQTLESLFDNLRKRTGVGKEIDELLRLLAMLEVRSDGMSGEILKLLARENDPVRGIHFLNCYSVIAETTSAEQAAQIGQFLTGLKRKIADRKLNTDRNWEPRMKELVTLLVRDSQISKALVNSPSLGTIDTLYIAEALMEAPVESVGDADKNKLADVILAWCRKHPNEASARHVKIFKQHADAGSFLRSVVDATPQLLSPAVDVLFENPTEADRATFVRGLGADRLQTQKYSAIGLRRLLDGGAESLSFEETQVAM